MANRLKVYLLKTLRDLARIKTDKLLGTRYEKFRRMGVFLERLEQDGAGQGSEPEESEPEPVDSAAS